MMRYVGRPKRLQPSQDDQLGDVTAKKDTIKQAFVKLLAERAPAAMIWHDLAPHHSFQWPEWSQNAFSKERKDWLALSQLTMTSDDQEVRHWGRFARLAANRIAQGAWQSPLAPLHTLRSSFFTLWLLDTQGEDIAWDRVCTLAADWLHNLIEQRGGDIFARAQLQGEADDFKRWLRTVAAAKDGLDQLVEPLAVALDDYVAQIDKRAMCPVDVPWATSAHVNAWEWHNRRILYEIPSFSPVPVMSVKSLTEDFPRAIWPQEMDKTIPQYVLVPALERSSWVRFTPEPTVFFGPNAQGSIILSQLYLWWVQQCRHDRINFVVTPSPIFESVLYVLVTYLPEEVSKGLTLWKQKWRNTVDALALADAWMWLEGAEPDVVQAWLKPLLGDDRATAWVLRLKTDPSYFLVVHSLAEQILEESLAKGYEWPGFTRGPIDYLLP
ncbi:MAG: hypothetical protein C7B47_06220 [Sulfobacillus thermosulfidooxidans]|uniref:Uncharacterized protein n=1 Tax=Sulfobacillus thermosulfidooxidans TaxID=28034 RepID=A0A2T2X0P8_SULTH|nr:MAG: hypothetical protein C7B47_06220 [Sulfobacillus thermosulfidooxidans]